jgi:hypothetical protein
MIGTGSDRRTLHQLAALVSLLAALAGSTALAVRAADAIQTATHAQSPQLLARAQSNWALFGCLNQSLHEKIPKGAAIFIVDPTTFGRQRLAEFAFWDYRVVDQATKAEYLVGLSRLRKSECGRGLSVTVARR